MQYILQHKNTPVLYFETRDGLIFETGEVFNEEHLPVPLKYLPKDIEKSFFRQTFRKWWKGRSIPASRQNLNEALEILGNITTDDLIEKSYGLSLSDQYWAKPVESSLEWEKINFFDNEFSEDVGKALFGSITSGNSDSFNLISPDNTSDGWLKKKWIINNERRFLVKAGSNPYQQEPFNEVLASEICRRLKIPYIEYKIIKTENHFFSACPDFINTKTELVSAWSIFSLFKKNNTTSGFNHLLNSCEKVGMKNIEKIKKQFCQMFLVDFIISNTDRHLNNFGFVRNADSTEWIGAAPIFDSGTSMFHNISKIELKNPFMRESKKIIAKPFASTQYEQIKKLPIKKYCSDLDFSSLSDISDFFNSLLLQNENIEEERRNILCNFVLKDRIREIKEIIG